MEKKKLMIDEKVINKEKELTEMFLENLKSL